MQSRLSGLNLRLSPSPSPNQARALLEAFPRDPPIKRKRGLSSTLISVRPGNANAYVIPMLIQVARVPERIAPST